MSQFESNDKDREKEKEREEFLNLGKRQFVKKNKILYRQGDIGSGFYCVEKGLIRIYTCTPSGDEKNLDFRGPGHIFGELALVQEPYITTAKADEDSVVYFFSYESFKDMIRLNDKHLKLVLNSLLIKLYGQVETKLLTTAVQQIAHALFKLADAAGKNQVTINQTGLANYTGLTRMTVNKVLKKWKEEGIIETHNKVITIKDAEMLSKYLNSPQDDED